MTAPALPPVDTGNQLLSETPAQLTTAIVTTPAGQRLAMTIRTASTTITVLLQGSDAKTLGGTAHQGFGSHVRRGARRRREIAPGT